MKSSDYTVDGTPVEIVPTDESNRTVYVHVQGNNILYLGDSTVTTATGMPTEKGAVPLALFIPANESLWAIATNGQTEHIRVLRPSSAA